MTEMENKIEQNLNDLILLLGIIEHCDSFREKFKNLRIKIKRSPKPKHGNVVVVKPHIPKSLLKCSNLVLPYPHLTV